MCRSSTNSDGHSSFRLRWRSASSVASQTSLLFLRGPPLKKCVLCQPRIATSESVQISTLP
eukprot:1676744-Pyramimonas_sp.AAC.1